MPVANTKMGPGGRVVIPAECRRELGLKPGDRLVAIVESGSVRLMTRREALRQARELVAKHAGKRDLVAELLADRRHEAERE